MKKYILIGEVNNILKERWSEALVLWKKMVIKSSIDMSYNAQFEYWLFNGSTLKLRQIIEPFGEFLGCIDFRNNVNAIDTALYIVRQRHISSKNLEGISWDATPTWHLYDGVELGSCYNEKALNKEMSEHYIRFDAFSDFTSSELRKLEENNGIIHTLYGHLKTGGVEALYDCKDQNQCRELAKKVVVMNDWFNRNYQKVDLLA